MLHLWKDDINGGVCSRDDLVASLVSNNRDNTCNGLILALKKNSNEQIKGTLASLIV